MFKVEQSNVCHGRTRLVLSKSEKLGERRVKALSPSVCFELPLRQRRAAIALKSSVSTFAETSCAALTNAGRFAGASHGR